MHELLLDPIEMHILGETQQRAGNDASTDIQLRLIKQQFNDNQSTKAVPVDKQWKICPGILEEGNDVILELPQFSTAA